MVRSVTSDWEFALYPREPKRLGLLKKGGWFRYFLASRLRTTTIEFSN